MNDVSNNEDSYQYAEDNDFCFLDFNEHKAEFNDKDLKIITSKQFIDFLIIKNKSNLKSIGCSINSIASSLFYNLFGKNPKWEIVGNKETYLFDQLYLINEHKKELHDLLSSIFLMTYRNGIYPIYSSNNNFYNTDCGWGCTIRAAQMMLSKGLMEIKKYKFIIDNETIPQYMNLLNMREEIVMLFNDNNLSITNISKCRDFKFIKKYIDQLLSQLQRKENGNGYDKLAYHHKLNQILNYEIRPPYSIQTICHYSQSAGKWTSGPLIIKTLVDLHRHIDSDIKMIYFSDGSINKLQLFETFAHENNNSLENSFINNNMMLEYCKEKKNNHELEKKTFIFKYQGVIFVTIRLGLKKLEYEYFDNVKRIFNLKNNIGFIGGKEDRAYYFLGHNNDNFIILDPHLNQEVIDIKQKNISSYKPKDFYLIKPQDMAPEITFGIVINQRQDLIDFITNVNTIGFDFISIN